MLMHCSRSGAIPIMLVSASCSLQMEKAAEMADSHDITVESNFQRATNEDVFALPTLIGKLGDSVSEQSF